jgi:predicted O-methyltransferase YrrM
MNKTDIQKFLDDIQPLVDLEFFKWPLARPLRSWLMKRKDPYPDVAGMASIKKLRLLNLAVSLLPQDRFECYLEIGTYRGKSLIAALDGNPGRPAIACDNFSEFEEPSFPQNQAILEKNIARYGLAEQVQFFDSDFRSLLQTWREKKLPRIGVYFYDGAHDEESQCLAIQMAEEYLADQAIVIIDDWRFESDSPSGAQAGTKRAIEASKNKWDLVRVLPASYNGDLEQWWNGVGLLTFERLD